MKASALIVTPCATPWLAGLSEKPDADMTLVCFGSAGSGGAQFRAWNRHTPAWLRVIGVQLPGREERYREPLIKDHKVLAAELANVIAALPMKKYAFFGHSFGALLAYETARHLHRTRALTPHWLCVAGRDAPHLPHAYPKTYALPEPEFIKVLRSYGGFDERILESRELLKFFLPIIRADLEVNTEYVHRGDERLSIPITSIRGIDDKVCSADGIRRWGELTTGEFQCHEWTGGHFFFRDKLDNLLSILTSSLAARIESRESAFQP